MLTLEKVKAIIEVVPDHSALEIAELLSTKKEVIEFLQIYQDFIGPIE